LIRNTGKGVIKKIPVEAIALTFDDGPHPTYTKQLLTLLKKYNVKATFFVVGSKVDQHPEIIKQMHHEGHAIGIHHYKHVSNWFISPLRLKEELKKTEKAIRQCINEKVVLYRPPWGHLNLFTLWIGKAYKIVIWSDIFGDWRIKNSKTRLLNSLYTSTKNGSIFVLHDCGQTVGAEREAPKYMLENLEIYLQEQTKKGTKFATLKNLSSFECGL
jgi:peptidoglycan/xylan/chitin deacetylase (PgdA/CDA1 family)